MKRYMLETERYRVRYCWRPTFDPWQAYSFCVLGAIENFPPSMLDIGGSNSSAFLCSGCVDVWSKKDTDEGPYLG